MPTNIYCTYLTIYKGNKLPPFYIGSTSVDKINTGSSKKYKDIYKQELINNPQLFKTKILTSHLTREEAFEKELYFQKKLSVVKSPMYFNESLAVANGYYGRALIGSDNPLYGKKHSPESIQQMKETHSNRSEETLQKMSAAKSGENNPMFGTRWFHNPITLESIRCLPNVIPPGFFPGRKSKIPK